ncbi:acyloxyacyl hydrolase [Methylophaga sp. OBS3]|uniref:acyloxyacyl hydrolase n=1 Tax=Methylophaga sp. OBS3 TaxID=2991934 RepID=UPI0022500B12|nr:acyloxyacyl hydrolase [Methylophaga sp. OBS3]MCX4190532.1 acyloxyacyl hydrolase [Methylophaga sp. OBS3]
MRSVIFSGLLIALLMPISQTMADSPEIAFSTGAFEVFESDNSAEFGAEYRFAPQAWSLVPAIGVSANSDGGYWTHAGLRYDFKLGEKFLLTPQLAIVGYEDGGGTDLGSGFLFRSGIELGYRLSNASKLSVTLYHMSNADLAKNNPGSESLIVSYSFTPDSWR